VFVTGLGPITASGIGIDAFARGLRGGVSPIREVGRFDASPFRTRIAAEVEGFDAEAFFERREARRLDRFAQFARAATGLALEDARLTRDAVDPCRVAIQMGSALGGMAYAEEQVGNLTRSGPRGVDPRIVTSAYCGAASCQTAISTGFTGPNSTNAMSCASGTIAVGDAFRLIQGGLADAAVAGGVEAPLAPLCFGAFAIARAMSARNEDPGRACRPFDASRDGFVMGEGACILVLEEASHALARGARVYAEIVGYAVTNDAHHMTAPRPDGAQAITAMRLALRSGGVRPDEVDHVNAHASSTPLNDAVESRAIREVLGAHADAVSVAGTKPYYGHALGASGAIEAAVVCLGIRDGWVPPTLNLEEPGEGCDLDYVGGEGRDQRIRTVLSNSFGFGGINAALVLRAPEEAGGAPA
jgi:3-oxoacyl-[acyl-carrier-protein] synthase II